MSFRCEICGEGIADGISLYRQNKPGELPARWRCALHNEKPVDPTVQKIVDVIEDKE